MEREHHLSRDFSFFSLFRFVLPSILSWIFIAVYQTVDGFFIGRYVDPLAISATNLFYPVLGLFVALGLMLGTGGNALMVRMVGEGRKEASQRVFSGLLLFSLMLSAAVTAVCLLGAEPIMRLCGATAGNIDYLRPYYLWLSSFAVMIILQSALGLLIVGEGNIRDAALIPVIGGIINCVLDYLLMKPLKMGIRGAAIATVLGYSLSVLYALWYYLFSGRSAYRLQLRRFRTRELAQICYNGSSDMVSNLSAGVTALMMNHLAFRLYSEAGVSALSVWSYLQFLVISVFSGFAAAVEPLFSFHYGGGEIPKRQKIFRYTIIWSLVLGVGITLLFSWDRLCWSDSFLIRVRISLISRKPGWCFPCRRSCWLDLTFSLPACLPLFPTAECPWRCP